MPKILDDYVKSIMKQKGMTKSRAYAIATASLQKQGAMKKGSQKLTPRGKGKSR